MAMGAPEMMSPQGGMPPEQGMMGGMQPPMGGPMGMEPPEDTPMDSQEDQMDNVIDYERMDRNLAKKLKKTKAGRQLLEDMGKEVCRGYDEDENSRAEWMDSVRSWLDMALLLREGKTFPWKDASNVKYPLMATAAMQFSARAYPALVPSNGQVVKTKVTTLNADAQTLDAARRIANHMSFQCFYRIPDWEEDMDKLLMTLAVVGTCFKKTYHDSSLGCHVSTLVFAENLCINYHAKSIEKAYRKTEILEYTDNDYQERVNDDERFLKVDLTPVSNQEQQKEPVTTGGTPPPPDKSTPHKFISCHTYWDLDDDGYEEPVIITVHYDTQQVVQIIARWDQDGVKRNSEGKIIKITPVEYFTPFTFIPNPDGSVYGLGFGLLLGPLNESVNTLVNQLIDAGTLNNLQAGFIGTGLRLRMGPSSFKPGEWKVVPVAGASFKDSIFPLPTKEPSQVLFNLMTFLITAGNQLASIAEIFVGKMPGQNTPATTTQETIQQGMAVFTAIYKRVYRSLDKEFRKLYRLNKLCPEIFEEEKQISGIPLTGSDYDLPDWVIMPGADPTGDSQTVRMQKMQQVGQLLQLQTINPMAFTKRMLEINEIPNPEELMMQPQQPPPDPKVEAEKAKAAREDKKAQVDMQAKQQDMSIKERQAALAEAERQSKINHEQQMQVMKLRGTAAEMKMNQVAQAQQNHRESVKAGLDLQATAAKHEQGLRQGEQAFQQKQKQQAVKEKATAKKAAKSKTKK